MPINLVKGEKISLTKQNPGLQKLKIGLSWDMKPGLTADLDASIFILGGDGKMMREDSIVFYNQTTSFDGAIVHSGDNRSGDGDGDDEVISVDLQKTQVQPQWRWFVFIDIMENGNLMLLVSVLEHQKMV